MARDADSLPRHNGGNIRPFHFIGALGIRRRMEEGSLLSALANIIQNIHRAKRLTSWSSKS